MNIQDQTIGDEVVAICDGPKFNATGMGAYLKNCAIEISVPSRALSVSAEILC